MDPTKRIVMVEWLDAEDPEEPGWQSEDSLEKFEKRDCVVQSVGFVRSETDKYITLVGDFSGDPDTFGRATKIPIKMLTQIEELNGSGPKRFEGVEKAGIFKEQRQDTSSKKE